MYAEDDMLMLSGIQHFVYCPRQWALIHIEQVWAENRYTAVGQFFINKQMILSIGKRMASAYHCVRYPYRQRRWDCMVSPMWWNSIRQNMPIIVFAIHLIPDIGNRFQWNTKEVIRNRMRGMRCNWQRRSSVWKRCTTLELIVPSCFMERPGEGKKLLWMNNLES